MRAYTLISAFLLGFVLSSPLSAADEPAQRDSYFIQHQMGANQGLYSLGFGYKGPIFEPSFSYGYTPAIRSGHQVTQGNIKTNWKVLSGKGPDVEWLIGASLLINISKDTFFQTPRKYPNRYYPPNAYFFALNTAIRHHGFYVEASLLDYYMEVAARNHNGAEYISELVSVGFGYTQDVNFDWSNLFGD